MSNILSLSKARKHLTHVEKRNAADANSVCFGRGKSERTSDAASREHAARKLDQHKLDEQE